MGSTIAVYSYGRFAEQAQGEPSFVIPVSDGVTALDRSIGPPTRNRRTAATITGLLPIESQL